MMVNQWQCTLRIQINEAAFDEQVNNYLRQHADDKDESDDKENEQERPNYPWARPNIATTRAPSVVCSVGTRSSSFAISRMSARVAARKAALVAEATATKEKENIEMQMLLLKQRAKRLEMKTQIAKFDAEQACLEEEDGNGSRRNDGPA